VERRSPSTVITLRRLQDAWLAGELSETQLREQLDRLVGPLGHER